MNYQMLTNPDCFKAITQAIQLINEEKGLRLSHHFTSPRNGEYYTEITDNDVEENFMQAYGKANFDRSTFVVDFYFDIFTDKQDALLDGQAGVKPHESIEVSARKRCAHLIFKAWQDFKKNIQFVDNAFLKDEAKQIVEMINKSKNINIAIVAFKPETEGTVLVYLTEKHVPQDRDTPNTSTYLTREWYEEEDTDLDGIIGLQHFKIGEQYWKYNGRIRASYIIFHTVALWLKNKHPDIYKQLAGK